MPIRTRPDARTFRMAVLGVLLVALAGCYDSGSSAPKPRSTPPASTQAAAGLIAQLLARPVHVPTSLPKGVNCTQPAIPVARTIPGVRAEAALGTGPVYVENRGVPRIWLFHRRPFGWWRNTVLWLVDPSYRGPVLVRGGAVHGAFPLGVGATGSPASSMALSQGRWSHLLPEGIWGLPVQLRRGWRALPAIVGVQHRGCYFLQVDGTSFSETMTFFAVSSY